MNNPTVLRISLIVLIVVGTLSAVLNGWLYLLEPNTQTLLFALLGVFLVIAGVVRLARQQRKAKR